MTKIFVFFWLVVSAFAIDSEIIANQQSVDIPLFLNILKRMIDVIYEFELVRDEIDNGLSTLLINSTAAIGEWLSKYPPIANLKVKMETGDKMTSKECILLLGEKVSDFAYKVYESTYKAKNPKLLASQSIVLESLTVLQRVKKQAMSVIHSCSLNALHPICFDAEGVDQKVHKSIEQTLAALNNYRTYFYDSYWAFFPLEGDESEMMKQAIQDDIVTRVSKCYDNMPYLG